jgi:hypothetical protein
MVRVSRGSIGDCEIGADEIDAPDLRRTPVHGKAMQAWPMVPIVWIL